MYKYFMLSTAIAGFLLCSSSCQQQTSTPAASPNTTHVQTADFSGHLPIAYVEVDSLLSNYNLAKDLNEQMLTRQENARATINEKGRQLEKEVAEFERKVKNNAFLSQERFEQEQQRLLKKQQELQAYAQQLENELLPRTTENAHTGNRLDYQLHQGVQQGRRYEAILNNSAYST